MATVQNRRIVKPFFGAIGRIVCEQTELAREGAASLMAGRLAAHAPPTQARRAAVPRRGDLVLDLLLAGVERAAAVSATRRRRDHHVTHGR